MIAFSSDGHAVTLGKQVRIAPVRRQVRAHHARLRNMRFQRSSCVALLLSCSHNGTLRSLRISCLLTESVDRLRRITLESFSLNRCGHDIKVYPANNGSSTTRVTPSPFE